ncbi:MAG: flavodoxin family protein [Anaerolineaceae bacterium]
MTKNLLALNFSGRKNGNCSIMMNEILRLCRGGSLNIDEVNVALLNIRSCVGCFGCNSGGLRCTLKDDLENIKEKIAWSDAILIVAPSYAFSAPGIMKNILDRCTAWAFEKIEERGKHRIGLAVSVGGAPEAWNALQRVFPSQFLKLFSCDVVYQAVYRGIGLKGEILLHPDYLLEMRRIGENLVKAIDGGEYRFPESNESPDRLICPVCKADVFQVCHDGQYTCAVCGTDVRRVGIMKNNLRAGKFNLFTPEACEAHSVFIGGKILNGMEASEEIKLRYRAFLDEDVIPETAYIPARNSGIHRAVAWDAEGIDEFEGLVPKMFQAFVKKAIERKASAAGYELITKEIFLKIKKESGN